MKLNYKDNIFLFIAISLIAGLIGGFISSLFTPQPVTQKVPNFENFTQSVVTVRSRKKVGYGRISEQIGTALAVKPGYLITNLHIIKDSREIIIKDNNGKEAAAKVIKKNVKNDLSILKVEGLALIPARLGTNSDIKLGKKVYAIGKPIITSNNFTVSSGIVSSLPIDSSIKNSPQLFQIDAAINPGNSGGPLINEKGEVIGITTAYLSTGDNISGIGFAVPIDAVKDLLFGL